MPKPLAMRMTRLLLSMSIFNRGSTARHSSFRISLSDRSIESNWFCERGRAHGRSARAHSSSGRMGPVYVRALTSVCQCTLPCADPWESAPASLRGSQSRQFCSLHKQSSAGNSERRTLHQSSVCDCRSLRRLRQCSSGLGLGTSQIQLAVLDGVRVCRAPSQQVSGQPHGSPAAAQLGKAVGPLGRDARSEREAYFLGR